MGVSSLTASSFLPGRVLSASAPTTGTVVPTATFTILAFQTVSYDRTSHWSSSTNSYSAPYAGSYAISSTALMPLSETSYSENALIILSIFVNGTETHRGGQAFASNYPSVQVSDSALYLNANDVVTVRAYQTSGSSITTQPGASLQWLDIAYLGSY